MEHFRKETLCSVSIVLSEAENVGNVIQPKLIGSNKNSPLFGRKNWQLYIDWVTRPYIKLIITTGL